MPSRVFAFEAEPMLWGGESDGLQAFNLVENQRQRGDVTWAQDLNALRTCCIERDVNVAIEHLQQRLAVTGGGGGGGGACSTMGGCSARVPTHPQSSCSQRSAS